MNAISQEHLQGISDLAQTITLTQFGPVLAKLTVTDFISKIIVLHLWPIFRVVNQEKKIVTIFLATLLFGRCIFYSYLIYILYLATNQGTKSKVTEQKSLSLCCRLK